MGAFEGKRRAEPQADQRYRLIDLAVQPFDRRATVRNPVFPAGLGKRACAVAGRGIIEQQGTGPGAAQALRQQAGRSSGPIGFFGKGGEIDRASLDGRAVLGRVVYGKQAAVFTFQEETDRGILSVILSQSGKFLIDERRQFSHGFECFGTDVIIFDKDSETIF